MLAVIGNWTQDHLLNAQELLQPLSYGNQWVTEHFNFVFILFKGDAMKRDRVHLMGKKS